MYTRIASRRLSWMIAGLFMAAAGSAGAKAEDVRRKEKTVLETPGWLPSSAAYSKDGKQLVFGGAVGEVAAYDAGRLEQQWKTTVGGSFAAVAYSSDGKSILATFKDGVQFLDAATGKPGRTIEEKESSPSAVAAFPDRTIGEDQKFVSHKIVFGNARDYFVKTWIDEAQVGGAQLSVVAEGKEPADPHGVPLAVDPGGRSVILTGPPLRDTGKNVLWAWVAGDYEEGSPGNRILEGHDAAVISAAWSKDGKAAASGDSEGRVIVWDAETMKEKTRRELGERIAAVAISPDGKQVAAIAVGNDARYFVWDAAEAKPNASPLAVDSYDYGGPVRACLAFSPNGRQLVGSANNLAWLTRLGELTGKVHVWETASE
jgi:WD40 repeat protein